LCGAAFRRAPAHALRRFCGFLAAAALAGCTGIPQRLPPAVPGADADAFAFSGRISLREQDRRLAGSIRWTHDRAHDDILVLSPLGQGVMRIERDAGSASLQTADGRIVHAADAESLALEVTGWRMPVDGLVHWVRGLASPGTGAVAERDPAGRLSILSEQGWRVEFTEYFEAQDERLPRSLVLSRPEFELKLRIDSWERAP
jgi:outer membrane lipoprotein LolB